MGLERQYKVCNLGQKAEIHWSLNRRGRSTGLSSEGRDPLFTHGDLSAPLCVCSPAVALLHKEGPRHRRKIGANSLCLYSCLHTNVTVKEWKYKLYLYISTSPSLFVQWSEPCTTKQWHLSHNLQYNLALSVSYHSMGVIDPWRCRFCLILNLFDISMKEYTTSIIAPKVEPNHQIEFSILPTTPIYCVREDLHLCMWI